MKTETELVCQYHFGDYHFREMVKRNDTPIDISPLTRPVDGLCNETREMEYLKIIPEHHDKTIYAVTWKK